MEFGEVDNSLYDLLGVPRDATVHDINRAYRKLALKYHPDRAQGDASTEEKFVEINNAHKILTDKNRRLLYDRFGNRGLYLLEQQPKIAALISFPVKAVTLALLLVIALLVLTPTFIVIRADSTVLWDWSIAFIPLWILFAVGITILIIVDCWKSGSAVPVDEATDNVHQEKAPGVSAAALSRMLLFLAFFILLTLRLNAVATMVHVSIAATCSPLMGWLVVELVVIAVELRAKRDNSRHGFCPSRAINDRRCSFFGSTMIMLIPWLIMCTQLVLVILRIDNIIVCSWWIVLIPSIVYFAGLIPINCCGWCILNSLGADTRRDSESSPHGAEMVQSIVNIIVGILGLIFVCLLAAKLVDLSRYSLAVVFIPIFLVVAVFAVFGCWVMCALSFVMTMLPTPIEVNVRHPDGRQSSTVHYYQAAPTADFGY